MYTYKDVTVVIPSLNPDEKFVRTVDGIFDAGFHNVILVNDGSREDCGVWFYEALKHHPECYFLTHEVNMGKGRAMKTAFDFYLQNLGGAGVITVDGDGQHLPDDVRRVAEQMVEKEELTLGVRDFSSKEIPLRSRFGNKTTSFMFRTACGLRISDTQTGLRAIPKRYLPLFMKSEGERYEYETNMLLDCGKNDIPFGEVKIETVYLDENSSSHFHPIRDSLRIYKQIFRYIASSLSSYVVETILFIVLSLLQLDPFAAFVISRVVSSVFNYFVNKHVVFKNNNGEISTLIRYYALAIPQMIVAGFLVDRTIRLLGVENVALETLIKAAIDTAIFFLSYFIQKKWVFKNEKGNDGKESY